MLQTSNNVPPARLSVQILYKEIILFNKHLQAHKLNRQDAMDHSRWRKLIKDD